MEVSFPSTQRPPRRHLRVKLVTQVESQLAGHVSLGRMENISIGGALVLSPETFPVGSQVVVRFNLPGAHSIEVPCRVAREVPGAQMGLQFEALKPDDRKLITQFVDEVKPYRRRSARLPRRVLVEIRWRDLEGGDHQEPAETRLLSLHGGMVLIFTGLKPGTDIVVSRPEKQRETRARVVFRALGGPGGRAEVAFEFLEPGNFWEVHFPDDEARWDEPY